MNGASPYYEDSTSDVNKFKIVGDDKYEEKNNYDDVGINCSN